MHSVAASVMGLAFALGIAACMFRQRGHRGWRWLLDVGGVTASVVLPLAMTAWPEIDGALQRAMFAIAHLWYGAEATRPRGWSMNGGFGQPGRMDRRAGPSVPRESRS